MEMPIPTNNNQRWGVAKPSMYEAALGIAKTRKNKSFFSKKPSFSWWGLWWSSCQIHNQPCMRYLCANQATNSIPSTLSRVIPM